MTSDEQIRDGLERISRRVTSEPPAASPSISRGHRGVLRSRAVVALATTVVVAGIAIGASQLGDRGQTIPPVGPSGTTRPSPARSDLPQILQGIRSTIEGEGGEIAVLDLDNQRQAAGFGVPVASMLPATDGLGAVTFEPIDRDQALQSCWPLMQEAAPNAAIDSWSMGDEWAADFPVHATELTEWQTTDAGTRVILDCVMPGTYAGDGTAMFGIPDAANDGGILKGCGQQAHLDFAGFTVEAADFSAHTTAAALRSTDGHLVSCVLSSDAALRLLQIPRNPIGVNDAIDNGLMYASYGLPILTSIGYPGVGATHLVVTANGTQTRVAVHDGFYALAIPLDSPLIVGPEVSIEVFGANGTSLLMQTADEMIPAYCLTPIEDGHGGC